MRSEKFSGLRRQIWMYFLPALCVILAAGAYLIYNAENDHLQYQSAAGMFFAVVSLLAIPFLFIRNIIEPLEEVLSAACKITEGYLKETVPIRNKDEIGKIGEQINALSVNLQEILLHVWNHSRDSADILKRISNGDIPSDMAHDIAAVRHSMEEMQSMVKTFEYYDIRMDEDRLMAEEAPNRTLPPAPPLKGEGSSPHALSGKGDGGLGRREKEKIS
ncbi:MAG: hypothetical protein BWK80_14840 [Desulfobacteraceae bacterium IS3]|nr:MAG: hypothetical protein BWK80_14840 [Desulfobacteraceae bacterium IS3]